MRYSSECWALWKVDHSHLICNDKAKIRWVCGLKVHDNVSSAMSCEILGILDLEVELRPSRFAGLLTCPGAVAGLTIDMGEKLLVTKGTRGRPRKS